MGVPRQMWAITINTGYGVKEDDKAKLLKFFNKQPRAFLITEKTDDKSHFHGGIMFDKAVLQGNVRNQLLRLFPEFDEKQKKHAIQVKNWYNLDWYHNYCDKDDNTEVVMDTFKPLFGEIFPFPDPDDKKDLRPISPWYDKLEKMILEDNRFHRDVDNTYSEKTIQIALGTYMAKDRTIQMITSRKEFLEKSRALVQYINQDPYMGYRDVKLKRLDEERDYCDLCPKCDSIKIHSKFQLRQDLNQK